MRSIRKYPRTPHVQGSGLQVGDGDLAQVRFADLAGRPLVVEEKLDGANCAFSFDADGRAWLQSRGHILGGGGRERQFDLFKSWVSCHRLELWEVLGDRYVVYGEWLFAKHTVFYDLLSHFFFEFDVLDLELDVFLSTAERRRLLRGLPLTSVPVVHDGPLEDIEQLVGLVRPSLHKSDRWREELAEAAREAGVAPERAVRETDPSDLAEGLYLKVEEGGRVVERAKWVRPGFLQTITGSGSHWSSRPIIRNRLRPGVDLLGGG